MIMNNSIGPALSRYRLLDVKVEKMINHGPQGTLLGWRGCSRSGNGRSDSIGFR